MEITLQNSNCMGLCNSHVFRVTGAHIHDFDEYVIECWLGWDLVHFSFDYLIGHCHSECAAFIRSISFSLPASAEAVDGEGKLKGKDCPALSRNKS